MVSVTVLSCVYLIRCNIIYIHFTVKKNNNICFFTEAFVADNEEIKAAMKRVYEENKYVVCPHTGVAAAYHYHRLVIDFLRMSLLIILDVDLSVIFTL